MASTQRKAKEKAALKALILQTAQKLFVAKGIEHTTIRSIADNIEYSVGTVYLHFKDKNEILHALHIQGFTQLSNEFRVLQNVANPMERLRAMGKTYIDFAQKNPEIYDLMFNLKAPMAFLSDCDMTEWQEGKATFGALRSTVADCLAQGYFKNHTLEPLAVMFWGVVHGLCSLEINDRIQGAGITQPERIVQDAYSELLKIMDKL